MGPCVVIPIRGGLDFQDSPGGVSVVHTVAQNKRIPIDVSPQIQVPIRAAAQHEKAESSCNTIEPAEPFAAASLH